MKVQWKETYLIQDIGEDIGSGLRTGQVIENTYTGDVIHKYTSFWGVPKFVVLLDKGGIVTVKMNLCKLVAGTSDIADGLKAIISDCDYITSGNVSHKLPAIKSLASQLLELIK